MKKFRVMLVPEPQPGGYSVTVPSLPGCFTQGETRDEAIANAREAIQLYLEQLQADGEPIPDDTLTETFYVEVEVPAGTA